MTKLRSKEFIWLPEDIWLCSKVILSFFVKFYLSYTPNLKSFPINLVRASWKDTQEVQKSIHLCTFLLTNSFVFGKWNKSAPTNSFFLIEETLLFECLIYARPRVNFLG